MNTVEDRLRDALRERARQSPIDPDAWERTLARTRRLRAGAWSRFMVPAAAAAAVVAIIAGAVVLTGRGGPHGGSGYTSGATASPSATPPPPPGRNDYEMQQAPPITAVVPVKLTVDGQTTWTFVWFGYLKNYRSEGIALCTVTDGDGYGGGGGCQPEDVPAHQVAFSPGPYGAIRMGTSLKQVTSVSAHLPSGRSVPGVVVSGRGFPYKFWAVVYPSEESAQIIFGNAGGHELGHLSMAGQYPTPSQPRSGGIVVFRYPAHTEEPKAGTMTAYLLDGRILGINGRVVGFWDSASSSSISNVPASGPPTVVNLGGGYPRGSPLVEFYGYAHENVTRVVLRLADGKQYGAQTFAAWKGSGLRLWAFSVPTEFYTRVNPGQDVLMGYDAAGRVIWQMRFGSGG